MSSWKLSDTDFFCTLRVGSYMKATNELLTQRVLARLVVLGKLAWNFQNSTGNRGDDVRALRLCELQPHTMNHPNNLDRIYTVLGLQGEEKAGRKGMQTVSSDSVLDYH